MPRVEANGGVKDIVGEFPGVLNEKRNDKRDARRIGIAQILRVASPPSTVQDKGTTAKQKPTLISA